MNHLLNSLNDAQKKAATHLSGPFVVFAGAGSGKTRIITTRIAYLIDQGILPWEILAVTFTNKAAGEMKERVQNMCPEAKLVTVTTFHSVCARWLREFAEELGFNSNFTIYDDSDTTQTLKRLIKQRLKAESSELQTITQEMKRFLGRMKTLGLFPHEIEAAKDHMHLDVPVGGIELYSAYQEQLASSNAMDFGDLLMNVLLLLNRNKKVKDILSKRYKHILVDEFQDTNRIQFELINQLCSEHQNLFVVGDDDQSIYSWRGANPSNILNFSDFFPGAGSVALEENYRCTGNIVRAASSMIGNNQVRAPKTLFTKAPAGEPIDMHLEIDAEMEANWVAQQIAIEKAKYSLDKVAIFYRTNSQSRVLEEALLRKNLPYTIYGAVDFYERLEIKDLLAYLKVLINEKDEVSLRRIINVPTRGLGEKAITCIDSFAKENSLSMMDAARQLSQQNIARISGKLKTFIELIEKLQAQLLKYKLEDLLGILLDETDYLSYLKKKHSENYTDKVENIQELGSGIAEFAKRTENAKLDDWLQTITLIKDDRDPESIRGVSLMTLHMAKGLEYPRVFIVGLEDGLLPHRNSLESQDLIEEERRLFYVGITRSKEKLSLLAAKSRRTFNQTSSNPASRFIQELPKETLKFSISARHLESPNFEAPSSYDDELTYEIQDLEELKAGMSVFHPTYGKGLITGFDDTFGQIKAIVRFEDFGLRKIRSSQLSLRMS